MDEIQGYRFAIDLDDGGMSRTLKEIRNDAKLLSSATKANFAEINSTGDAMRAYSTKAKDASRAIDAQRLIIQKAQQEQKEQNLSTEDGRWSDHSNGLHCWCNRPNG